MTRKVRMGRSALGALWIGFLLLPGGLQGQSLFNAEGLGLPMEAPDARARALGGEGLGLRTTAFVPGDPSSAARLLYPVVTFTAQPSWTEFTDEDTGEDGTVQGVRFPSVGFAYPAFGGAVTLMSASLLDQRFRAQRDVVVSLAGGDAEALDQFEQEGGVSSVSLGYARALDEATTAGVVVGRYTGSVRRVLRRVFDDEGTAGAEPYVASGEWGYGGYSLTGAITRDFGSVARIGASATWSSRLDADASEGTEGVSGSYDLPLQLRVGASAVLAPGLMLAASTSRAGWSAVGGDLGGSAEARDVSAYGVGLELSQARLFGRRAPLRVGYRTATLPFARGTEGARERAFVGGVGLGLSEAGDLTLASVDLGIERGERTSSRLNEQFWRATVSVQVSGF